MEIFAHFLLHPTVITKLHVASDIALDHLSCGLFPLKNSARNQHCFQILPPGPLNDDRGIRAFLLIPDKEPSSPVAFPLPLDAQGCHVIGLFDVAFLHDSSESDLVEFLNFSLRYPDSALFFNLFGQLEF